MSKTLCAVFLLLFASFMLYSCITPPDSLTPPGRTVSPAPTMTWQQRRAQAVEVAYDELLQNADDHVSKTVFFRGKVIQVVELRGDTRVWVSVSQENDVGENILFLRYHESPERISIGDIVAFTGWMTGTRDYKAAKIPSISVRALIFEGED